MATFSSKNPGFGELGFIRNIAGYLTLASIRAAELANLMRSCGAQVAESWRGDAHAAWDAQLTEQASATQALAPQWDAVSGALTTYADTVQGIFDRGEGYRATIDSHLSSAASSDISVRFMVVDGQQYHVTLTPQNTADATGEARASGEARAEELQELINAQIDAFWALQSERDAADSALTGAVGANFPAGWSDLKAQFPAGTNPSTMLPVVPREFYGYDGIDAAGEVAGLVDPATGAVDPAAWTMINSHMEDPIFREHFMAVLGPERAVIMGYDAQQDSYYSDGARMETMKVLLAAGAPPARYNAEWMQAAEDKAFDLHLVDLPPTDYPTSSRDIMTAHQIFAEMLGDGKPVLGGKDLPWNQASLALFGNTLLLGGTGYKPTEWMRTETSTKVLDALSNNVEAAAIAFGGRAEDHLARGADTLSSVYDEAYARFIRTATLDAANTPGLEGYADSNVAAIINHFGSMSETNGNRAHDARASDQRFSDETREVFGNIAANYWDDFEYTLNARWHLIDDPSREGVECNSIHWTNFLLESMRNPDVGAGVLGLFEESYNRERALGTWDGPTEGDQDGSADGTYLLSTERSNLDAIRHYLFSTLIEERKDYQDKVNESIGEVIDFAASVVEGPKDAVIGFAKDAAKSFLADFLEYSDEDLEKYRKMDVSLQSGSTIWELNARDLYGTGAIQDVYTKIDGQLQPSHADPHWYERQATIAAHARGEYNAVIRFTDDKGIKDLEELRTGDPRAYAAYISWLADPAVQNAVGAEGDPFIVKDTNQDEG